MSLQKLPLYFSAKDGYNFDNNRDFLQQTEGHGIKCTFCDSKVFYGYGNWKSHCKTKRHQDKTVDIKGLSPEEQEIKKLKLEIKKQKILTIQESNKCEVMRNKFKEISKELKNLKKELKAKFKI
jgi:ribosomal protein L28